MKRLIVTGDDFGLSLPVNRAIEQAHREGILTTASLMVGAPAAADAISRARKLPALKVGLHLAVTRCRPTLPQNRVKDLVDDNGELPQDLVRAALRFFFLPGVKKQLAAEIRGQFEAFRSTGLTLDHVNAHNHMHLHPTVFRLLLDIGADYGLQAVRIPYEPPLRAWRGTHDRLFSRLCLWLFLTPWIRIMRQQLHKRRIRCNEFLFGLTNSGAMTQDTVLGFIKQIPDGISEIYFHPAVPGMPGARPHNDPAGCSRELDTLLSREITGALKSENIRLASFGDIAN